MRVGILGCGYVGLELCRQLTTQGHDVVGVRRSSAGVDAVERAGGTAVQADLTWLAVVGVLASAASAVYYLRLAAIVWQRPRQTAADPLMPLADPSPVAALAASAPAASGTPRLGGWDCS